MKVLVCGGRDFDDYDAFKAAMRPYTLARVVIHGGARGADALAARWANYWGVPVSEYRANWKAHGNGAGPIRNQRMIDEGKPDVVLAFPGGRGTADMVRRARAAGIDVVEVSHPPQDRITP